MEPHTHRLALRVALLSLLLLPVVASYAADATSAARPWRLQNALALPDWLTLSVQHRMRYESIDGQFRRSGRGGDQGLASRTLVAAEARKGAWRAGAEMLDARLMLDDGGTPLDTAQVNSAELLQAYLGWRVEAPSAAVKSNAVTIGRQTIDFGTRRLIARNAFRNTINGFTGADWQMVGTRGWESRVLAVMPVARRPDGRSALASDASGFDEEDSGSVLWAAALRSAPLAGDARVEGYLVGFNESDERFATRNRRIYSPGLRWWREPSAGRFDFELESILQFGEVRATNFAFDRRDLDHFAHLQHAQLGYSFVAPWAPRVVAQFDYASGDEDPNDGDNGRFDTLFSARRFEFGPTGLWGAFSRANLVSAGARVIAKPNAVLQLTLAHRGYWLAETRDAWVAAGVRDSSGQSGSFIGQQLEWNAVWTIAPGNLALEVGGAWLSNGEFIDDAPQASGNGDSSYFYTQVHISF